VAVREIRYNLRLGGEPNAFEFALSALEEGGSSTDGEEVEVLLRFYTGLCRPLDSQIDARWERARGQIRSVLRRMSSSAEARVCIVAFRESLRKEVNGYTPDPLADGLTPEFVSCSAAKRALRFLDEL
jgi:hypothetical protein